VHLFVRSSARSFPWACTASGPLAQVPDYYNIITKAMDFGTIEEGG